VTNSGGVGIEGINLALSDSQARNTTAMRTAITLCECPAGGNYTITPSEVSFALRCEQVLQYADHRIRPPISSPPTLLYISGHVNVTGGAPLADARVTLSGAVSSVC